MKKLKFAATLMAIALTGAGGFIVGNASAETKPNQNTVTPPTPKPIDQAIKDLQKQVPIDMSKVGEPLPRNLWVELSKLLNPTVVSITTTANVRPQSRRYRDPLQEFMEEFYGGRGFGNPAPQMP
ncbi:MAG TPA: hypothetical protein VM432_03005, partial [Bdellovibrionales bacterium]|nr:hypothetical protein [Bdellovibrionales bacterium]